jgi:hypothetical protein
MTQGRGRGTLGCIGVMLALLLCSGVIVTVMDGICYDGLTRRLPTYPGAQVLNVRYNLFRPYGMGNTVVQLYSADDQDTVRAWYARQTGTLLRALIESRAPGDNLVRTITQSQFDVTEAADGTGSQILLFGTCVN